MLDSVLFADLAEQAGRGGPDVRVFDKLGDALTSYAEAEPERKIHLERVNLERLRQEEARAERERKAKRRANAENLALAGGLAAMLVALAGPRNPFDSLDDFDGE